MSQPQVDVAVVGGGIAGLAAAWRAYAAGQRVVLFEAGRSVGGKMRSEIRDGYLVEHGPNSFMGSATSLWSLIDEVGLAGDVVAARPPADRFVYRDRRARKLPTDPKTLLTGDYMSTGAKLRLLAEPAVAGDARPEDTVWDFACRRIGEEAARYLIAPFVSGVYAGDPRMLGARDAFPKMWQWEHESGSLTLGALLAHEPPDPTTQDTSPRPRGMYSLRGGLGALPLAIARALPQGSVRLHAPIAALRRVDDHWQVCPHPTLSHGEAAVTARHVVLAAPAHATAELVAPLDPHAAALLGDVFHVRVAVVHLGGADPHGAAPAGFGVLIPPGEGLRTLGVLFPSSIFAGRAPDGHWLHTGFLGGANDPEAVDLPDETLTSLVAAAQAAAFDLNGPRALEPTFATVVRWREAIPQYRVGHRQAMAAAIEALAHRHPGLWLAGSHLAGISMADAAASGLRAADATRGVEVA